MKILIKILTLFLILPGLTVASGGYRDTYESEVQRQIFQLEQEKNMRELSPYEQKRKDYLEKRLKTIKTIGITSISFSSGIKNGEAINSISSASYKQGKIYLFISIENMDNQYLTHVWIKNGNPKFKKRMKVRGTSWRMWTWITLNKNHIGSWKGIIYDDAGNILATKYFTVTK